VFLRHEATLFELDVLVENAIEDKCSMICVGCLAAWGIEACLPENVYEIKQKDHDCHSRKMLRERRSELRDWLF